MLKLIFALLIVCFLLLPPVTALADVVYEPENDFYVRHQREIVFLGRSFVANGNDGSVPVSNAPDSSGEVARLQNGRGVYVDYTCLYDREFWGYTQEYSGWIKLDQMLVQYDYVAFEEDHLDEFYIYDGDYAQIKENRSAIAWQWPGTDVPPLWTFEGLDAANLRTEFAYMDEDGREWGFVTYLYGSRNIWICLSDPLDDDIPVFNPEPEPRVWVSDTAHTNIAREGDSKIIIIVVLVAALAIGTIVLIKVFWKRNGNLATDNLDNDNDMQSLSRK